MRVRIGLYLFVTFIACFGLSNRASADWINMTGAENAPNIAEITIEEDHVKVALEIYLRDIGVFVDLIPDDLLNDGGEGRPNLAERLEHFSMKTFKIASDEGEPLKAELVLAEPRLRKERTSLMAGLINPTTGRKVPEAPADKRVLYAEVKYPFKQQPNSLTFTPPVDENGAPLVNMGFITYHKSAPVIDFRFLSNEAKLSLNWNDPWYSAFENPRLTRHHKSGLMSFLYVEPYEVRHEVLARVKDLENWLDLELRDPTNISSEEWDGLKQQIGEFFMTRNKVSIDGKPASLVFERADFVSVSLQGVQVLDKPQSLDTVTAMLGVILTQKTEEIAKEVTINWDLFSDRITLVPVTATDPAGPFPSSVEPSAPEIRWENFLNNYHPPVIEGVPTSHDYVIAVPLITVGLITLALVTLGMAVKVRNRTGKLCFIVVALGLLSGGAFTSEAKIEVENPLKALPNQQEAAEIISALVSTLHTAHGLRNEERLHEALTLTVSEDHLDAVSQELRRALKIEILGGGVAQAKSISDVSVRDIARLDGRPGFQAYAEWSVDARATHWGHLHQRRMRFYAILDLAPIENKWKLLGITVVEVRQEVT